MLTITLDGNEATLTGTTKGDPVQRAAIRRPWVWSRAAGAWVLPRNLRPATRDYQIRATAAALRAAGLDVEVEDTGTRLTVAEERDQERERLEARADRYEDRAERLGAESESRWKAEHALLDPIPFGQPNINGRLTPLLKRAEQHRVAAHKAGQESERLADLAGGLRRALQGTPQVTLLRRIERYETEVRDYDRRLAGTSGASGYGAPVTGEYRERLLAGQARVQEALDLDRAEVARRAEEDGVKVWTRADFVKGDEVLTPFGWFRVLRVNAKSVTVPHGIDALAAAGHTWTRPYAEIRGRRRDGVVTR